MGCLGLGWQGQALAVLAELEVEGLVPVLAGWAVLQVRGPELVVLALAVWDVRVLAIGCCTAI